MIDNEELRAYDLIAPFIREILEQNNISHTKLHNKPPKSGSSNFTSLYIGTTLLLRIRIRSTKYYIEISEMYPSVYSAIKSGELESMVISSKTHFLRLPISNADDVLTYLDLIKNATIDLLDRIPKDFSCCSRYEACSNAQRCTHPDQELAWGCNYKKVLRSGRAFYGDAPVFAMSVSEGVAD